MKKHLIALPLAALAVISMTGCSYPGSDEVANEYYEQVRGQQGQTQPQPGTPAPAQPTQDAEQGSQSPSTEAESSAPAEAPAGTEAAAPSQEAGTTIDLGGDDVEGTVYLEAIQGFSPEMDKYVIDGDTIHYAKYTCLGEDKGLRVKGTLVPWDEAGEQYEIEWLRNTDVLNGPLSYDDDVLDTSMLGNAGGGIASTDLEAEQAAFSSMCLEAGEAIAGFVL